MTSYKTIELPTQLYTELQRLAEAEQTTPIDLIARLITPLHPAPAKQDLDREALL